MSKAKSSLMDEVGSLRKLTVGGLRERYLELFGEESASRNKDYLFKRIVYRLQELKYGGLTPIARERAALLAEDAPIRRRIGAIDDHDDLSLRPTPGRDARLPPAGTKIHRTFNGTDYTVTVLDDGFLFEGRRYKSLSVIAREISGTRWNGFGFFGLLRKESA